MSSRLDQMREGDIRSQAVENVDRLRRFTYEFAPSPAAHLAEYDEEQERLSRSNEHTYYQHWKLVHSGQVRTYYNAGCSCGWRMRKRNGDLWFRCSDEDAVTDWFEHSQAEEGREQVVGPNE